LGVRDWIGGGFGGPIKPPGHDTARHITN